MRTSIGLAFFALLLANPSESAATVSNDLCAGDPCVVSTDVLVDDGSVLDFGAVDLVFDENVTVSVRGTSPSASFQAGSIVLAPGATINRALSGADGPDVTLIATSGNVELQAAGGNLARLDLDAPTSGRGGDLEIRTLAPSGDVLIDGEIDTSAGHGGDVWIVATGAARIGHIVTSASSAGQVGGRVTVTAVGRVDVVEEVRTRSAATAGSFAINVSGAPGDIHVHPGADIDVRSTAAGGWAGDISWTATGDLLMQGRVTGTTTSSARYSESTTMEVDVGGDLTIDAPIDLSAGNNSHGNLSTFRADDGTLAITANGSFKATGKAGGSGGEVAFFGDQSLLIQGPIDVSDGQPCETGCDTGPIFLGSNGALTIAANVKGLPGGRYDVYSCDIIVTSGTKLDGGRIVLNAGRFIRSEGQIKATESLEIEYLLNYPELLGLMSPLPVIMHGAQYSCGHLAVCGNGVLDVGEDCDDGNTVDGDCCDAACAAEPAGQVCGTNWGLCAASECDGAGSCGAGTPGSGCFQGIDFAKSKLQFKDKENDRGDLFSFQWLKGEEVALGALPDPVNTDDIEFCVYDFDGRPIFRASAPVAGTCAGKPCWKATATGFKYSDKERTPDGVLRTSLKAGAELKGKADIRGKGENVPNLPPLPLRLPVLAQIQTTNGTCWEAAFGESGVIKSSADQFKGRAQPTPTTAPTPSPTPSPGSPNGAFVDGSAHF